MSEQKMIESVKEYLRIDGSRDDKMLQLLIDSAKEYLDNSGVKEDQHKASDQYKLAIIMLVTHWYENREQVTGSVPNAITLGLQSIILQLKVADRYESN